MTINNNFQPGTDRQVYQHQPIFSHTYDKKRPATTTPSFVSKIYLKRVLELSPDLQTNCIPEEQVQEVYRIRRNIENIFKDNDSPFIKGSVEIIQFLVKNNYQFLLQYIESMKINHQFVNPSRSIILAVILDRLEPNLYSQVLDIINNYSSIKSAICSCVEKYAIKYCIETATKTEINDFNLNLLSDKVKREVLENDAVIRLCDQIAKTYISQIMQFIFLVADKNYRLVNELKISKDNPSSVLRFSASASISHLSHYTEPGVNTLFMAHQSLVKWRNPSDNQFRSYDFITFDSLYCKQGQATNPTDFSGLQKGRSMKGNSSKIQMLAQAREEQHHPNNNSFSKIPDDYRETPLNLLKIKNTTTIKNDFITNNFPQPSANNQTEILSTLEQAHHQQTLHPNQSYLNGNKTRHHPPVPLKKKISINVREKQKPQKDSKGSSDSSGEINIIFKPTSK